MRRLLRWTFNTLAAVSLLLCIATAGLWVRSYWVYDDFEAHLGYVAESGLPIPLRYFFVYSYRGHFAGSVVWSDRPQPRPTPPWEFEFYHSPRRMPDTSTAFRFSTYRQVHQGYVYTTNTWAVRDWSLVSAFAVLPAIVALRQIRAVRRRRRRSRLGLCPACGYDLRASPGQCPECGRGGRGKDEG